MITTVFFDFDGVLTLNEDGYKALSQEISKESGVAFQSIFDSISNYRHDLALGDLQFEDCRGEFCKSIGLEMTLEYFYEMILPRLQKNEEMFALARDLKRAGYTTGIITNNPEKRFQILSQKRGLSHTFDVIALPAHVGSTKNAPAIFEYACTQADITVSQALFIDNKEKNLQIPKQMGMLTYHFDTYLSDINALLSFLSTHNIDVTKA